MPISDWRTGNGKQLFFSRKFCSMMPLCRYLQGKLGKLGPILWLFYVNDRTVDNFNVVKYADDTTFYKTVRDPTIVSVAPAIVQTQLWSENNSVTLNTEKTVIINISLNRRAKSEVPLTQHLTIQRYQVSRHLHWQSSIF